MRRILTALAVVVVATAATAAFVVPSPSASSASSKALPAFRRSSVSVASLQSSSGGGDADADSHRRARGSRRLLFWRKSERASTAAAARGVTRKRRLQVPASLALLSHLLLRSIRPANAAAPLDPSLLTSVHSANHLDGDGVDVHKVVNCGVRPGATLEQAKAEADARMRGEEIDLSQFEPVASTEAEAKPAAKTKVATKKKGRSLDYDDDFDLDDDDDLESDAAGGSTAASEADEKEESAEDMFGSMAGGQMGAFRGSSSESGVGAEATSSQLAAASGAGARSTMSGAKVALNEKARSNLQRNTIVLGGGGYVGVFFGYEAYQWYKEQRRVDTSLEIIGEQAKELFGWGENETASDEELAEDLKNATDTDGDEDDDDEDDDDDDDDDEPRSSRGGNGGPKRGGGGPRAPFKGGDYDDDSGGSSSGSGDGPSQPSGEDLDRISRMFKKS